MNFRVLGCSSAIGEQAHTSSYLIDDDILIDAGTGVSSLSLDALQKIDHVFLTHSHLDHIACLPLMADSVGALRDRPITIHARAATLEVLRKHILNWQIWPDFTVVPSADEPFMTMEELTPGEVWEDRGRSIRSVAVNHTVPAVGYIVNGDKASLALSGDTTVNDEFWKALANTADLRHLILETTFPERQMELAALSKHLCPSMVQSELKKLKGSPEIFITHMMPHDVDEIMGELAERVPNHSLKRLEPGQTFAL